MNERRKAEQLLIERSLAFAAWARRNPAKMPPVIMDVIDAADQLEAIPLELPTAARTNRGAPLTAQQAGAWMKGERAASTAGKIVRSLYRSRDWIGFAGGLTTDDIEQAVGGRHQTVSARVHELARAGWLRTEGTRPTRSGRQADVYYLTDQALTYLTAVEAGEP